MKLNCIAVDDEPRALDLIVNYIEQVPFLRLMDKFRNPISAFEFVKSNKVDLFFLDINMPNLTGLQFIKSLQVRPQVILTTAYSEYAVESYGLDVLDYLLKPIEFDRFFRAVNKAVDKMQTQEPVQVISQEVSSSATNFIFVKDGNKLKKVDANDIHFIEASGNYMCIQLTNQQILTLTKMNELLDTIGHPNFIRVHKSYAVNITKIDSIENHRIYLGEKIVPISETYRGAFYGQLNSK